MSPLPYPSTLTPCLHPIINYPCSIPLQFEGDLNDGVPHRATNLMFANGDHYQGDVTPTYQSPEGRSLLESVERLVPIDPLGIE